jgi:hypothetical protein
MDGDFLEDERDKSLFRSAGDVVTTPVIPRAVQYDVISYNVDDVENVVGNRYTLAEPTQDFRIGR